VVTACRSRDILIRTLPTTFELLSGGVNLVRQVRELKVEDVLGREPVRVELDRVGAYLRGQTVLVTGAGGSIGSELCRQIARVGPRKLVLVENGENLLFEVARELEDERHFGRAVPVLADVKDATRMAEIFEEHEPSVVFHAAAYKHVGLMEENPVEAIRNNAVATRIVAAAAGEAGVDRFVLVSTDKAVAPATVMGASKALAEWAVEAAQHRYRSTKYAAVRFGNVLGSSGSVVPIFRRQIAAGGPVTVTDEKMSRYFMTIPEAVQLIIRSGELAAAGEVFVLEMGDPVKIVDLARNMIRLAGLEPDEDIAVEIIGQRPGEKIHEDLFNPGERPQPTPAEKIVSALRPAPDPEWVEAAFLRIEELVYAGDAAALAGAVAELSAERSLMVGGSSRSSL
jgi:FlaA1/EpsC-like NDP-sugar epimerase